MTEYLALCHIDRGSAQYNAGDLVPLPEETAARLLAMDPPAIALVAPPEPAALARTGEPAATPSVPTKATRPTAQAMIERVKDAMDLTALLLLQEEEHGHPDGPRKTVVAAIEDRFDALGADAGDDA